MHLKPCQAPVINIVNHTIFLDEEKFKFRIRDFMLNKKDILGWNISIKLMDIQSMLN